MAVIYSITRPKSGGYGTPHSEKWGVRVPPVSYAYERLCCHTVERTQLYCFLQLLEVSALCLHTCTKTLVPLVNCIVNDALVDVTPHLLQMLFQFVNVVHP